MVKFRTDCKGRLKQYSVSDGQALYGAHYKAQAVRDFDPDIRIDC